ncbi:CsgE family curli-type amyloid fiber assembly protein [Limnohabitans sp.]|uniref:CsgE family curli-type amyloid fiber assembly protein n=1 Tax=Limnohabitans sp. TaxID=1907725 RepID=UPI0038BBAAFE
MFEVVTGRTHSKAWAQALLCACLCLGLTAQAQTEDSSEPALTSLKPEPEYGGVVTREVLTTMGQNFHAKFTELWQTKDNFEKFNLLIKERPFKRGGTEILVVYTDLVIFRRQVPRDFLTLARISQEAVDTAVQKVSEIDLQATLFKDVDLAESGI